MDARRLERAQQDVGKQFGRRAGRQVDGRAVVGGGAGAAGHGDVLFLEELVAGELAAALDQVADGRGPEAGEQGRRALSGDDCAGDAHHVEALHGVVGLDPRLDVDGRGSAVGERRGQRAGAKELDIVAGRKLGQLLALGGHDGFRDSTHGVQEEQDGGEGWRLYGIRR